MRKLFPDYDYLSVEDPVMRSQYLQLTASQWKTLYPHAILDEIEDSIFQKEFNNVPPDLYLPSFLFDKNMVEKQNVWEHYLKVGAYPAVSDESLSLEEKYIWLQNYVRTYLERDIRDLASFRDLEPFVKLQRFLAINTGTLVNATSIAARIGLSAKTVLLYIRYFEISYPAILLPAWSQNANKRLSKMPKIHFLDNGIIQAVLQKRNGLTGNEFESLVIAEIYKQIQTIGIQAQLYHLRTHDGKEVDLLIEMPDYYFAFEIKMTDKVTKADAKHLIGLENILNKPIKKAFILSNDRETKFFGERIVAINVTMFLG